MLSLFNLFRIVLDDCMTGGKEARKQNRTLTKLFPNKITIHMPQVYTGEYL